MFYHHVFKGAEGWNFKGPLSTTECLKLGLSIQGTKTELNPLRPEILEKGGSSTTLQSKLIFEV